MKGVKRSPGQLARDRRRISSLYLRGWIQADIAKEIKLSQTTVSRDISWLQGAWLKSALVDFNEVKAKELAKVDDLEREYWLAWRRSCKNAESETRKAIGKVTKYEDEKGQFVAERPVEITTQSRGQVGDPRFLQGVQWCLEQRLKIFGIYAPTKVEVKWREELDQAGIDTDDIFERTVDSYLAAIEAGEIAAESGSMAGSTETKDS